MYRSCMGEFGQHILVLADGGRLVSLGLYTLVNFRVSLHKSAFALSKLAFCLGPKFLKVLAQVLILGGVSEVCVQITSYCWL